MQAAAAAGSLATGTLSDRLGRRRVLAFALIAGPALMLLFLAARGWEIFPILAALGMTGLATTPVQLTLVQEYSRDHPATANGIYMATSFAGRSLIIIAVGAMADHWGLRPTFQACALLSFAAAPFVLLLPKKTTAGR
jgi:FSR family fosmidomycin resistance protein-like MFS transporter